MTAAAEVIACDTSVAVPLLLESHPSHRAVAVALQGGSPRLLGHAAVETYSVLTRLPGDGRLAPRDAVRLIEERFGSPSDGPQVTVDVSTLARLAAHGVSGGATYDALVAVAALAHGLSLASRDLRAIGTYATVGVRVLHLAS